MRKDMPGTVVITPNIPANVANAEAKESKAGYLANSDKSSSRRLGSGQYNPKLGKTISFKEIIGNIRAGQSLPHWLNYYLSLRFADKQYDYFTDENGMPLDEFYGIAVKNYHLLCADSKLNLATISELGLKKLTATLVLSDAQWNKLIENDQCAVGRYISDDGLFDSFYRELTNPNQLSLRAVLFENGIGSSEALTRFLHLFDITTDECNTLVARHNKYQDYRLGSAQTDRDTLIDFLNSLRKDNRMAFITSNHLFLMNQEVGFLWSDDKLKCDDFTATDLIKILEMLESRDQRKIGAVNLIFSSLALSLIARAEDTLSQLKSNPILKNLFQEYLLFQSIIHHCALKVDYNENQARDAPIAFNQTDNLEYKKDGNVENMLLKPLTYKDMIRVADTLLKDGIIDQAVSSYLQAMNRGNRNVDPQILINVCTLTTQHNLSSNYDMVAELISLHITEELENRHLNVDHQTLRSLIAMEYRRKTLLERNSKPFCISQRLLDYLAGYTRHINDNYEADPLADTEPREFLVAEWKTIIKLCEPGSQQHIDILLRFATMNDPANNDIYREVFNELNSIRISPATKPQIICARLYFATALKPHNPDLKQCFVVAQKPQSYFFCLTKQVDVVDRGLMSRVSKALARSEESIQKQVWPFRFSEQQMGLLTAHFVKPEPVFVAMPTSPALFESKSYVEPTRDSRLLAGGIILTAAGVSCAAISILSIAAIVSLSTLATFILGPVGLGMAIFGIALLMKYNKSAPTPEGYNSLFGSGDGRPPSFRAEGVRPSAPPDYSDDGCSY